MLFPRSHSWTPLQKWLIVGSAVLGLIACGVLIHSYERYYRGPDKSALFGTWVHDPAPGDWIYWQFLPDGTLHILADQGKTVAIKGKWYAGGPNIYLRIPPEQIGRALVIWHIVDISADQFRVQAWRDGEIMIYKRITLDPPHASNQSMERTAGSLALNL